MLTRFTPFDRTVALMDDRRRRMDHAFADFQLPYAPVGTFDDPWSLSEATWPRVNVYDPGASLLLTAEVPGMAPGDLQIQIENDVLTIRGERQVGVPQGFTAHRHQDLVTHPADWHLPAPRRVPVALLTRTPPPCETRAHGQQNTRLRTEIVQSLCALPMSCVK